MAPYGLFTPPGCGEWCTDDVDGYVPSGMGCVLYVTTDIEGGGGRQYVVGGSSAPFR